MENTESFGTFRKEDIFNRTMKMKTTNHSNKKRAILFSLYLLPFMLNFGLIDFLIPIKYDIILNNLPLFGTIVTIMWLASTFLDFAVGSLTDRLGIKKTLRLGVFIAVIGALLFGISSNVYIMSLGVFIWGLSYVMFTIPSETYVLSKFPKNYNGSAFGIFNFALDISYAIAPLAAFGIIYFFGVNSAIISAGLVSLLTLVLISGMKDDGRENVVHSLEDVIIKDGVVTKGFRDLFKMNSKEYSVLFNMFVCGLWFMAIFIGSPLLFFHESGDILHGALLTFAFMLPFALMELGFGDMANSTKSRMSMIKYGFFLASALLGVFFYIDNFIALMAIAFCSAFFANMAWVASEVQVSRYLPKGKKGEFTSIFITAKDIGYDLAPILYGFTALLGLKMPFLILGGLLFIAWISFMVTHRNEEVK